MGTHKTIDTTVLIVGAGAYGISLSYELHCRRIPFVVVGLPFWMWRFHTLNVYTLRSNILSGEIYTRDQSLSWSRFFSQQYLPEEVKAIGKARIPIHEFRRYAEWILLQLSYQPIEEKVVRLEASESSFTASTDKGSVIKAKKVVLATGTENHKHLPGCLRDLPSPLVAHSWYTADYEALADRNILVIGGGQSAAEVVVALSNQNRVTWVYRSPLVFYSEPLNIPTPIFRMIRKLTSIFFHLPPWIRKALGRKFTAPRITPDLKPLVLKESVERFQKRAEDLGLVEKDRRVHSQALGKSFDSVIACTGFHYRLSDFRFISDSLRQCILTRHGVPVLNRDFSTSVPDPAGDSCTSESERESHGGGQDRCQCRGTNRNRS